MYVPIKSGKSPTNETALSIRLFLFFPAQSEKLLLVEGVWSLGGEAGFVLAAQDPVRQRELDLGVLQESERRTSSV